MGECMKVHSLAMRDEFERASLKRDYGFEEEVLEYLQSFIKDNERKIELAKKRIESVEDSPELERLVIIHYNPLLTSVYITGAVSIATSLQGTLSCPSLMLYCVKWPLNKGHFH